MLSARTGCPRCSRARDAMRPADTGRWAASVAPAASKISRDSRENSLRWRRNGAAKRGARRDARRPDRAKASRLDPCYIKFRAEIKDSYPDCDDEEEESEEEEENDDYAGASARPGRRKRDPGGQSCTGAASQHDVCTAIMLLLLTVDDDTVVLHPCCC